MVRGVGVGVFMLRLLLRLVDDCAGVARETCAGLFEVEAVGAVADGTGVEERDTAVRLDDERVDLALSGRGLVNAGGHGWIVQVRVLMPH
jgi:hypothetical protein